MEKRWELKKPGDKTQVKNLSEKLGIDDVTANLLVQRGVKNYDEAKYFFRPQLSFLHPPFLMKDMDKAISRIETAIVKKENILIYGDYDVDGTTAVALVYTFFKKIISHIDYYIPDRYSEGYGISFSAIDFAEKNNFSLIIALDCGIKANDKIDYANKKKIDFIICDHHRPGNEIPNAVAVLDPKRSDCNYPFDELSGCGIGFKLIQAYAEKNNFLESDLLPYLDLVAISIAADIVPIVGENRILAHFGLKQLNASPRAGIKAILQLNNVKKEISITEIVFIISPRINAAGRMESGNKAVELLISEGEEIALNSGRNINITNTERKNLDTLITRQALDMIEEDAEMMQRKTTVLFHPEWHKGVIGIVASRLIEKYYRPTVILTESSGKATGSVRSVKDFDVYNAIEKCSDLLEQFGGHKYAAGLTLKLENVKIFSDRFEKIVSESIEEKLLTPEIEIDAAINLEAITPKFFRLINQFAPFGPQNMAPIFTTKNVMCAGNPSIVGTTHLKFNVADNDSPKNNFSVIAFNMAHKISEISEKKSFDICYSIEENEWNGNVSLQLVIKDIRA
ncbi:MAG TPA: single-stranded-DNA-specific exonuclease RecJ [Bacteroidia bacterium]|nr:single-stranded-DNA-specific exonuclease RecJ [Bacteroidia bacterium]